MQFQSWQDHWPTYLKAAVAAVSAGILAANGVLHWTDDENLRHGVAAAAAVVGTLAGFLLKSPIKEN